MKWIVLSIVLFIAIYTFITLYFRKPGTAYQPYKDSKDRAVVQRLEQAGFQRVTASVSTPADPQHSAATLGKNLSTTQAITGGLPADLNETLLDKPALPESFANVVAPRSTSTLLPYAFQFTCTLPDKKAQFADAYVYVKGNEIAIIANFEAIGGDLLSRSRESAVLITLPGGTLKPGDYRVTLLGARSSCEWTLQVH
jgi:hypothetical protein